jgi:hypothetical protein
MHDRVLTPRSKKDRVRDVMGDVAEEVVGFKLPVVEKGM